MAKLVIRIEGLPLEVIKLKGGLNRFGRSSQNDFQIDHPTVSRFHAEIVLGDKWMFVRDTDSSNGVFVNGKRVSECLLESGQFLRLGEVSLEVENAPVLKSGLELAAGENFTDLVNKLLHRKEPISVLPARMAGGGATAGVISCPSCAEHIVIPAEVVENLAANTHTWQQRALAAEQRAERAHAAIRAGVLPQLADWLKHKLVHGLVSERSQMLDAQKSAAAEMAELERRLDALHAPLQERLRAYEKRITELERMLDVKGEENRELLRAKIQMTRQQLENTRTRNRVEFN
jgi:pSer/pThr/pTyr-binding forkhead associated (FHA) protein